MNNKDYQSENIEFHQTKDENQSLDNNRSLKEFEVPLQLSDKLKDENIIQKFVKNHKHNYIKIELNHKYEKSTVILTTVNIRDWSKFHESIKKSLEFKGIHNQEHIRLIMNVIDDNYKLVYGINDNDYDYDGEGQIEEEKSLSQILVELVLKNPTTKLFKDELNVPHILIMINKHYRILPINSIKLKRYLAILYYYTKNGKIANSEAINSAVLQLEAKAFYEGVTISLHLRAAWLWRHDNPENKDCIYYDLSDEKNRCVKIIPNRWTILDNQTNILFRRYDHQIPQIEPSFDNLDDQDDVLDQFITLLNIKNKNDRLLLKCYIISLFIPDFPHVVLILLGEQGGAKSTLQELIRSLVDPSILSNPSFPSNENEFVQQLSHSYLLYYDNVSVIPEWVSNLLCRAVTGSSLSKRALYTNDEDIYYRFKRKLGINGIALAKINSDLSDRSITIKPERIDKLDRIKLEKIWNQFNALKPRVLSYIFNILSKVLKYKETHGEIKFPNGLNRMADWEEYAEVISRCMGNPEGEFQKVYQENINKQVDDAVASSQLCMAVIELMRDNENSEWENTPTGLYDKLTDVARYTLKFNNLTNRKYWPQSPASLSYNLNKVKTILREKGIEVITGVKNTNGVRVIKLIKLNSSYNVRKTSSISSISSKENESSTKEEKNLDDFIKENNETSSKTSSTETSQIQAHIFGSGRFDDPDNLSTNESRNEKYLREQEEIAKWNH